jgi:hypothetical protein
MMVRALRPQGLEDLPHLDDDYFEACFAAIRERGLIPGR